MNSLPTELVAQIIFELSCEWNPQLPRYATINPFWQDVVESQTFRTIHLSSLDFPRFREIFGFDDADTALGRQRRRRRAKLRHLEYFIDNSSLVEGLDNINYVQNDPRFLESYGRRVWLSIHEIWEHLASWKQISEHPELPSLAISSLKITLPSHPWKEELPYHDYRNHPIPYVVYGRPGISTSSKIQLSPLASVKRLWIRGSQLWPADLVKAAENLSTINELGLWASDWKEEGKTPDAAARDELAKRLSSLPHGVEVLVIDLAFETHPDADFEPIDLCSVSESGEKVDHFSCSVRAASYLLTSLTLSVGMISPEVFWPANSITQDQNNEVFWPNLETFKVNTSMCTAYGTYAMEKPDLRFVHRFNPHAAHLYDWEVELEGVDFYSRQRPDHKYHDTLCVSIAKAASRMPRLKVLKLLMRTQWTRELKRHEFSFRAEAVPCGNPRVQWSFECNEAQLLGWQPPREACDLWKEKCGPSLQEDVVTVVVLDVDGDADDDSLYQDFDWEDDKQTYPVRKRGGPVRPNRS
ncbi:hypothetical protein K402DRAFT_399203 [Aulographum hederae CBS 113979]|uniref:Uncharacterized protein n=1 Tax=Aulographum hederae CBS 113979 TaxID=1176131 RepID=A0A6G1GIH0_9PEZI|nr:hypothetical protein K402DRAFT_399203 [Aulographum hederae CBS 113979]